MEILYSFFEDIFSEEKSLEQISELYRHKGIDVKFKDEANELFKKHIQFILAEKKHLISNKIDLSINEYEKVNSKESGNLNKKTTIIFM